MDEYNAIVKLCEIKNIKSLIHLTLKVETRRGSQSITYVLKVEYPNSISDEVEDILSVVMTDKHIIRGSHTEDCFDYSDDVLIETIFHY
jgi:hypothetical protein